MIKRNGWALVDDKETIQFYTLDDYDRDEFVEECEVALEEDWDVLSQNHRIIEVEIREKKNG